MVERSYMLARPAPPSAMKVFFDQSAMPRLIDAAGACEVALEQVAQRAKRAPLTCSFLAVASGWLLERAFRARRR